GDLDAAGAEIDRALVLAATIPESLEHAPTLLLKAELQAEKGETLPALRLAERALDCAAPLEQVVEAHVLLANLHLRLNHVSLARANAAEAVAGAERLGSPRLTCLAHLASGTIGAAVRNLSGATAAFEAALRYAQAASIPYERALVLRTYAEYLAGG